MSQEQPPIRSRRELRRARDEEQAAAPDARGSAGAPGNAVTPGGADASSGSPKVTPAAPQARPLEPTEAETTGRRRIPGPVDAVRPGTPAERSSQVRARDRAALRTIKELAEKEGQLSPGGPPTRRQLRLQQLAEETAPATSANPIVPMPSPRTQRHPVVAPKRDTTLDPAPQQASGEAQPADTHTPSAPEGMSVEQALAARELLAAQARNQVAKMEHIAATDPDAVDPEVLAQQIALAERAAVLNRRAAAKQKLAEQTGRQAPRTTAGVPETGAEGGPAAKTGAPENGPSTASNLAMVTPLEFVEVPGMERPVMKRPATSYVPLVTNPGPKVQPRTNRRPGLSKQQRDAGRTGVLARAEAAAKAGRRPATGDQVQDAQAQEDLAARPPVAANAAYGLDPLDAATAGLGRARRLHLLQLSVLALGVLALVAGVILIITGMGH